MLRPCYLNYFWEVGWEEATSRKDLSAYALSPLSLPPWVLLACWLVFLLWRLPSFHGADSANIHVQRFVGVFCVPWDLKFPQKEGH